MTTTNITLLYNYAPSLNVKIDYLIIHSRISYKRVVPWEEAIYVDVCEIRRSLNALE